MIFSFICKSGANKHRKIDKSKYSLIFYCFFYKLKFMSQVEDFKTRLDQVIEHVCETFNVKNTNGNFFSIAMQMDNANYQRWVDKGFIPSKPMKLLKDKHGINPAWVNEGKGEMLLSTANLKAPPRVDLLNKLVESLERENALLRQQIASLAEENARLKGES